MNAVFVTGTDTEVGKTLITAFLARYLLEKGYNVITQKWIQTGCTDLSSDIKLHLKIMGKQKCDIKDYIDLVCPYRFRLAAGAHLASKLENKRININKIIESFKLLSQQFDFVIVEGLGGVLVPFNKKYLVVDIARTLDLPVLVVAENKLGAINHTLLTLEALNTRKMKIWGIVFNNSKHENKYVLEDNPQIVKALTREKILGVLPWINDYNKLYERFVSIGDRLLKYNARWIGGRSRT